MGIGSFIKVAKDKEKNRMLLPNSHRKVLANFNTIIKELDVVVHKSTEGMFGKEIALTTYVRNLLKTTVKTKYEISIADNTELKEGALFKFNKVLLNIVNAKIKTEDNKGKPLDIPALYMVLEAIYGSKNIAKTKYNTLVELIETNFELIEEGNNEKSSIEAGIRGAIEKPFKAATKAIGMGLLMGTPLGVLAPFLGKFGESAINANEANRAAAGQKASGLAGFGGSMFGGGRSTSSMSTSADETTSAVSGKNIKGSKQTTDSLELALYNFFNKTAFQAEYTKKLLDKTGKGGTAASGGLLKDLVGGIQNKLGGAFNKVGGVVGGVGKSVGGFLGAVPGTAAAGGALGTTAAIGGSALAGWMAGRAIGGIKAGDKTIDQHVQGMFGNVFNKMFRGKEVKQLEETDNANKARMAAFKKDNPTTKPIETKPVIPNSIVKPTQSTPRNTIDKTDRNAKVEDKPYYIVDLFGQKRYHTPKAQQPTNKDDSVYGQKIADIQKENAARTNYELNKVPNTELAKVESNNKSIKDMTDKFSESMDKIAKTQTNSGSNRQPTRSLAKNTGNPFMDYTNMGLMGGPG